MDLKISEIMKQKGISIESLKKKIEDNGESLSRTSISNIINNKSVPKVDTLEIIADALSVTIQQLFNVESTIIHVIINNELKTFQSIQELKEYVNQL